MKILLDENISYRVIKKIAHLYPNAHSISELGLIGSKDHQIWAFAKLNHYTIFTNDEDL
jgi:predicted nuclease of predicted toxin-antitoxin system